ncbi:acetylornithine deacetylase [Streptosporangium subroseum]|uniref:Acetylornithine deacetylase n=2 Tax=Streptosporangium subroseum TaxID=106412 RepID=A0A239A9S2_9ACTN|nr:acetylornithine deacetylase [Streptosporangium subroseum]
MAFPWASPAGWLWKGSGMSQNEVIEARVLDALDEAETVRLLADLVRVPSVTGTDAESDLQHRCARLLVEAGLDVDVWKLDLDELRAAPGFPGTEAPRTEGYGVVGVTEGEGEPALVLQGHADVVPIGDPARWEGDPFAARISGNIMHGRGACDMKAGLAANLAVVAALSRSGVRLARPLALHCVVGEEDGGLGAFATLARGHRGEAAVIAEPTSGAIIAATAGALTFRIEVAGRAAHGATRYEGINALEVFWPVFEVIRRLEADRNRDPDPVFDGNPMPYPIEIGTVRAGDWASSVPDLLVAEGRLGVRLDEDPAQARLALETVIAELDHPWLREHPPVVTWPGGQFASGRLPAGHALLGQVATAVAEVTGSHPAEAAAPYGSDLRLYAAGGIPALHYGPGDVRFAHAPREQVDLRELRDVTRVLALLALRRCGVRG